MTKLRDLPRRLPPPPSAHQVEMARITAEARAERDRARRTRFFGEEERDPAHRQRHLDGDGA
jgi:hypothetical protein